MYHLRSILGKEDSPPSLAQLWSVWGAPTDLHQREPRLRPSPPHQGRSHCLAPADQPDEAHFIDGRESPTKNLVNSLRPLLQACRLLRQQLQALLEHLFMFSPRNCGTWVKAQEPFSMLIPHGKSLSLHAGCSLIQGLFTTEGPSATKCAVYTAT